MQAKDYKHIMAWHALTGSMPYYWQRLQAEAINDKAPANAIYKDCYGRWRTTDDLFKGHPMLGRMERYISQIEDAR